MRSVEIFIGDIRQVMVLTMDQLKAFNAQSSNAIAKNNRLVHGGWPRHWVPQ